MEMVVWFKLKLCSNLFQVMPSGAKFISTTDIIVNFYFPLPHMNLFVLQSCVFVFFFPTGSCKYRHSKVIYVLIFYEYIFVAMCVFVFACLIIYYDLKNFICVEHTGCA